MSPWCRYVHPQFNLVIADASGTDAGGAALLGPYRSLPTVYNVAQYALQNSQLQYAQQTNLANTPSANWNQHVHVLLTHTLKMVYHNTSTCRVRLNIWPIVVRHDVTDQEQAPTSVWANNSSHQTCQPPQVVTGGNAINKMYNINNNSLTFQPTIGYMYHVGKKKTFTLGPGESCTTVDRHRGKVFNWTYVSDQKNLGDYGIYRIGWYTFNYYVRVVSQPAIQATSAPNDITQYVPCSISSWASEVWGAKVINGLATGIKIGYMDYDVAPSCNNNALVVLPSVATNLSASAATTNTTTSRVQADAAT